MANSRWRIKLGFTAMEINSYKKCELWAQAGSYNSNVNVPYGKQEPALITATAKTEDLWHCTEQWCFFTLSSRSNSDHASQLIQMFKVLVLDPPAEHEFVLEYSSWIDFFFSLLSTPYKFSQSIFKWPLCKHCTGKRTAMLNTWRASQILIN